MYAEEDLIPISALQHMIFCPRQCALIHLEQIWVENRLTAEGRVLHERVDAGGSESRGDVRKVFSLALRSLALGLSGIADVVEYHRADGRWLPFPVEHKCGKPRSDGADEVQLCAQALCLEEMTGAAITEGALFYGEKRRRKAVPLTAGLRERTRETALKVHDLFRTGKTPKPVLAAHCESCSLIGRCLPETGAKSSVAAYLAKALREEP